GLEWLVYDFIEGVLLSRVDNGLAQDNREAIYVEMGRQLGQIHQHTCDFFGSMDEKGNSIHGFTTLKTYFSHLVGKTLKSLHEVEHADPHLIRKAESAFLTLLNSMEDEPTATLCHNDFGPRNILVSEDRGKYTLKAVIDFEQSVPTDRAKELIDVYLPLLEREKQLASGFRLGYELFGTIDVDRLLAKRDFYNLFCGLSICAWSKDVDYLYYLEGARLLEKTLARMSK
ncbi:MAG TPA: aminoglycoside phosphotransferase family protein, partial [Limnochordia bacterium]|nr:aminoglycoside phosphotransferase family protein [Limnochordia bacterium]